MPSGYGDGKAASACATKIRSASGALPFPAGDHRKAALPEPPTSSLSASRSGQNQQQALGMRGQQTGPAMLRHCRLPVVRGCSKARHRLPTGLSSNFTSFSPPPPRAKIIFLFLLGSFHLIFCFIQQLGFSLQRDDDSLSWFLFSPEDRSSGKRREGFLRSVPSPHRQARHRLPTARVAG